MIALIVLVVFVVWLRPSPLGQDRSPSGRVAQPGRGYQAFTRRVRPLLALLLGRNAL